MPKYQRKPVIVEAKQFWPRGHEKHDPSMVVRRKGNTVNPPDHRQIGDLFLAIDSDWGCGPDVYMFQTLRGCLKVLPGDWIVVGPDGEKFVEKSGVFESTHDLVS